MTCRFVDVPLPELKPRRRANGSLAEAAAPVVRMLGEELTGRPDTSVVAWREGVRWQRHLGPWKQKAEAQPTPRLREGGVYLITGGLGGIAGVLAEWLISEYRARLVLVGRTPLPARGDWDEWLESHGTDDSISRAILRVRELEALGGEVLPLAGDVTVAERMQEIVQEAKAHFGAINGVFHTAGVIRDNLIQLKTQRDIEEVFAAKVYGTMVLEQALEGVPLDFMLLFSSNSAFVAPQGQVDYVGANSFLNAWADARRGVAPYPVIAVNWGIWKNVGLGAGSGAPLGGGSQSHPTSHPLFQERLSSREGVQQVHRLRGTLSAKEHWVIDEHRLGSGEALLPGTGYLELIRAALAEAEVPGPWQIAGLLFQQPLFVRDETPRAFELRLNGSRDRWQVEILAAEEGNQEAWATCATAKVLTGTQADAEPLKLEEIRARCTARHDTTGGTSALRTRQEDHLRFGPRWRVLKQIAFGEGEALAQLALPDDAAADTTTFALHPALLDIATGCAMDLIPGYAAQEVTSNLWAPLSYRRFAFRKPLQPRLVSWVRLNASTRAEDGFAVFDVTLASEKGDVLAHIEQFTLRRIDGQLAAGTSRPSAPTTTADGAPAQEKSGRKAPSQGELALQHNYTQGIDPLEGMTAIQRLLQARALPSIALVSSMALADLLRQADAVSAATTQRSEQKFARPQLDSEFEAPRNEVEKALAELWGKLLGVDGVGIRDSFFDLGGHSLVAVRLFNAVTERFGVDLPMSVMMQAPTIADLAKLIAEETGEEAPGLDETGTAEVSKPPGRARQPFRFIVPMHSGPVGDRTPLFMVSGMFGNVLNLSHLAHLLGEDRPFYALQARGLFGDEPPHETFEEMATDYLEEIRQIQPHGPYLLGGFSGGGVTAY
ncbi:MAG: SDR family NAD(P)-dependent oxidoreductase, partial [Gammaproteobacteria bacterium]|nr:SDR family NAD(P)-dependent oxidoreductase [Gammaproteobacteria bacterium]